VNVSLVSAGKKGKFNTPRPFQLLDDFWQGFKTP